MSFRKEKKYRLTFSELAILKQKLLNSMTNLYPPRIVNSCYFDTELKLFNESEEGILPRKKSEFAGMTKVANLLKKLKYLL